MVEFIVGSKWKKKKKMLCLFVGWKMKWMEGKDTINKGAMDEQYMGCILCVFSVYVYLGCYIEFGYNMNY